MPIPGWPTRSQRSRTESESTELSETALKRSSVDDGDKEGLSHLPRHMRAYSRDDFVPSRASPPATPTTPTADDASLPVRQLLAICWLRMSHPMALKLSAGIVEFR